jgi:hypothetical protein
MRAPYTKTIPSVYVCIQVIRSAGYNFSKKNESESCSRAVSKRWHTGFRRFFLRFCLRVRFHRLLRVTLLGTANQRQENQQNAQSLQ